VTLRRRPGVAADLPMVFRAERDYIRNVEPDQEAAWTAAIDRNLALWIAELDRTTVLQCDGRPAGFATWTRSGDTATLVTVQVLPEFRRRGLGRLLVRWFIDQARSAGCAAVELGVHRDNPARDLYEGVGFTRVGEDGPYLLFALPSS